MHGLLIELAQLDARELSGEFQQRRQRINPLHFRQSVEIAFGLLGDLQRRPESDDAVRRKITEQAGGFAGFGQLALDVDDANRFQRIAGAKGIQVESADGFDLIVEEIDADGEAELLAGLLEDSG